MTTTRGPIPDDDPAFLDLQRPIATGGTIVVFRDDAKPDRESAVLTDLGFSPLLATTSDEIADIAAQPPTPDDVMVLPDLGIAVISPEDGATPSSRAVSLMSNDSVQAVLPEFYVFADLRPPYRDNRARTWGVEATGALHSRFTGRGIRVAILDTGLDLNHPDFAGRAVAHQSFVPGQAVQDLQGHGTHCAGTAVGRASRELDHDRGRRRRGSEPGRRELLVRRPESQRR